MYKEVEKMTNSKKMNPQKLKDMLLKYALYIILLLLLVVIVAIKPNFLSVGNLISILKQASTKGILAYGVAGIIILAGTDLSVGRVLGLCAAVAASMLQSVTFASRYYPSITEPLPLILPFLVCVAIAVIISAFNGFGMAKLHMHPFIVTLGTQLISYGLCCIYIENQPSGSTQALSSLDARYVGRIRRYLRLQAAVSGYHLPAAGRCDLDRVEQDPLRQEHVRRRRQLRGC